MKKKANKIRVVRTAKKASGPSKKDLEKIQREQEEFLKMKDELEKLLAYEYKVVQEREKREAALRRKIAARSRSRSASRSRSKSRGRSNSKDGVKRPFVD